MSGTRFNQFYETINLDVLRDVCQTHGVRRRLDRGEYFLRVGEVCNSIGLIESGYIRYIVNDTMGRDQVVGFVFNHEFVADFSNSITQSPAIVSIQAGKTSFIREISLEQFRKLCISRCPELERNIMHVLFQTLYNRFINLYRMSPRERYLEIIKAHPSLLQDVPLRDIASYLQISPIHLSRIRKSMLK